MKAVPSYPVILVWLIDILSLITLSVSHSDLSPERVQLKLIPEGYAKGKVYLIGPDNVPEYFPLRVNFPVFSHSS